MFKLRLVLCLLIVLNFFVSAQTREPVAVLDFIGIGVSQADAATISSLFTAELVRASSFEVMDRKNIDAILAEHKLQLSGCTDTSCAIEIGQILSLQYIFSGEVSKLGDSYVATINFINVETSKIENSTSQRFARIEDVYDVLPLAIGELTGEIAYQRPELVEDSWWDGLAKSQRGGFITMLSGVLTAGGGSGLLAYTSSYNVNEVDPLKQIYLDTGGGFEAYSEKASIKNTLLISSASTLGVGVLVAVTGTLLWLIEPKADDEDGTDKVTMRILPYPSAVTVSFQYQF